MAAKFVLIEGQGTNKTCRFLLSREGASFGLGLSQTKSDLRFQMIFNSRHGKARTINVVLRFLSRLFFISIKTTSD